MGGRAFSHLPPTAFPRLPPQIYHALKARLQPRLQSLYALVAVPAETPEKKDHGDIDFVVAQPVAQSETNIFVSHEEVKNALGASFSRPPDGNRTSHYALPLLTGEQEKLEGGEEQYVQVDVHVCADKEEWERVVFFHGYGDLGMIIGVIARSQGLSVGTKGLKISNPPPPLQPFHLSSEPEAILSFFGLSMGAWRAGFATQLAAFEWAARSRLFDPVRMDLSKDTSSESEHAGARNAKERQRDGRHMYQTFREWARSQPPSLSHPNDAVTDALDYFGKGAEFDGLILSAERRKRAKEVWNGQVVRDWTGLRDWREVKAVMTQVREQAGGEEGVGGMEVEELRTLVVQCLDGIRGTGTVVTT